MNKPHEKPMKGMKSATLSFASMLIAMPLTLFTGILVARFLGPETRGQYGFLMLIQSTMITIFSFGYGNGVIYHMNRNDTDQREMTGTTWLIGLTVGIVSISAMHLLLILGFMGPIAGTIPMSIWLISYINTLLLSFISANNKLLVALGRFIPMNLITILTPITYGMFSILMVVYLSMGLLGAILSILLSYAILSVAILAYLWYRLDGRCSFNGPLARNIVSYGIRSWITDVSFMLSRRLDTIMVSYLTTPFSLGLFQVASNVADTLCLLTNSIDSVIFNKIAAAQNDLARGEIIARVHRTLFALVAPITILVMALGFWLIPLLYGKAYSSAVGLFVVLCGASFFTSMQKVLTRYFTGGGKPHVSSYIVGSLTLVSLGIYPVMIMLWSTLGAAMATLLVQAIGFAVTLVFASRDTNIPAWKFLTCQKSDMMTMVKAIRQIIKK
jgi:O-antigen/teichoic acid export membrane protein